MSENTKRFKNFRNELTESEYREVLTGYPNRDIHCDGPVRFDESMIARVNAMLNAISRSTYLHPGEAFIKIKTRLNILMLDFPWTPYLWSDGGVGTTTLNVTRYGRVDGVDAFTNAIRTDGKANTMDGFKEFTLVANIERAEDGLYRVSARLEPKAVVVPESVQVEEDLQTPAREAEMKRKVQKHEDKAQSGYEAKMTKTGKAAARGRKQEDKHDAASRRLLKKDQKEQDSPRTYGRGGKLVKRGSRAEVKEEIEQIDEKKKMKTWSPRLDKLMNNRDKVYAKTPASLKRQKERKEVKEAAGQEATAKKVVDNAKKIKKYEGKTVKEALTGGQKRLDVNKNKRLDAQDFAMLRAKKKPMKEYLDMASGMALQSPAPGDAIADKSGKGKRFHKKAMKSVEEALKKPTPKAAKPKSKIDPGAMNVHGQQKAIKKRLDQYGSSW